MSSDQDTNRASSAPVEDADPGLQERDRLTEEQSASEEPRRSTGAAGGEDKSFDPTWTNTSMPDGNAPDVKNIESVGHAEYESELDRGAPPAPMPKSMEKPRKGTKEPG